MKVKNEMERIRVILVWENRVGETEDLKTVLEWKEIWAPS